MKRVTREHPEIDHLAWRADFPALDQTVNGFPLAYLDSAATTQRPVGVLAALQDYYRHDNANPGRNLHALARRAYERYEGARRTAAGFIHAQTPDEVVWVRGTREGINLVASAWARPRLRAGDEILLTVAEHASNLLPWRLVAEQTGATIRYVDSDDEARVRLEDLERHEARLTEYGLDRLSCVRGLRLLGPRSPQQRLLVFSFVVPGHAADEILKYLDAYGIAVRAGDLASLPLLKRLGVTEAVRASCYLYTETSELDRLADALDAKQLKRGT
jgi:selenocysteine lyase/cysteine desulfurase